MRTYCFHCKVCGGRATSPHSDLAPVHDCPGLMVRDYRAEAVGFNGLAEMARQRELGLDGESGRKAQRDIFLPTADEMRSPTDPTGQNGIRKWNDTHRPKEANVKPLYPEMDKRYY